MHEKNFVIKINNNNFQHKTRGVSIERAGAEGVAKFLETRTEKIERISVHIVCRMTHLFLSRDLHSFANKLLEAQLVDQHGLNPDEKGDNIPYFATTEYIREGNVFLLSNANGDMASVSLDGTIEI